MTEEEFRKLQEEAIRQQQEAHLIIHRAQRQAQERQQLIDAEPRTQYTIIVAVDADGGFGKDGKIPWHYTEDLQWFSKQTAGGICVMGRTTYEDICNRLGDKALGSVLPNRKCLVVSSTLDPANITNATVIKSINDISMQFDDEDFGKPVFLIGGEQIFRAGLSMADRVLLTVINQSFDCDRFFPTDLLAKRFQVNKVFTTDTTNDLRFVEYLRKR
jgi:dihydrofolate reductase